MTKFKYCKYHINAFCKDLKIFITNELKENNKIELIIMYNPIFEMYFYCSPSLLLEQEKEGNIFYSSIEFTLKDKITIKGLKEIIFNM